MVLKAGPCRNTPKNLSMDKRIVLLACPGDSTHIVFHLLQKEFGQVTVIMEERESLRIYLKRRIKRLGIFKVFSQLLFQFLIAKPLFLFSGKRIREIISSAQMDTSEIPEHLLTRVSSVNTDEAITAIQKSQPDLIVVNGTRIIARRVLEAVSCRFINMHAGITPKYRGVHGAYWALVNRDPEHCGVTIHFVDKGIDTGNIILQEKVMITAHDNFVTYPYLQLAAGLGLMKKAINAFFSGTTAVQPGTPESFLWYHPGIGQYLYHRIFKGVR